MSGIKASFRVLPYPRPFTVVGTTHLIRIQYLHNVEIALGHLSYAFVQTAILNHLQVPNMTVQVAILTHHGAVSRRVSAI